jgi:hypothetical protein
MNEKSHTNRRPVKRDQAETYLLISLIAFSFSVIGTRLFLQIAGYPRLGNSVLHIAHALWGGLLLMVSGILPLVLSNRWALDTSAALNGIGSGLFVDEVGKFITHNNDYFYPPAAPLIYASFLMLVLIFLFVRRLGSPDPRTALYHATSDLRELADNNLDHQELRLLLERLDCAKESHQPQVAGLALAIEGYLRGSEIPLVPLRPGFSKQVIAKLRDYAGRIGRSRLRLIILVGMLMMAFDVLFSLGYLTIVAVSPSATLQGFVSLFLARSGVLSSSISFWQGLRIGLEILIGLLMLVSAVLIFRRREHSGMLIGIMALLISLTGLQLLSFYLDQFGALATAFVQFHLLLVMIAYRRLFLYSREI